MPAPEFSAKTIEVLSKRAALRCSNPDCDKLTTGPNSDGAKTTNIGEAAHIYGARPRASRYREEMQDEERAAITNAIWLRSDCHSQIDRDALLLLWRDKHEQKILVEIGKPGELLRRQAADRELRSLGEIPLYAEQLIRQKPELWEFMLTAELLDYYLKPVLRSAEDLDLGLIVRPKRHLRSEELVDWLACKPEDLLGFTGALELLLPNLNTSWGEPGQPGDAYEIAHTCKLIADAADHLLQCAEDLKFMRVPTEFTAVSELLMQGALHPLYRLPELSKFIRSIYAEPREGTFHFNLVIDLPDGWAEKLDTELQDAWQSYQTSQGLFD